MRILIPSIVLLIISILIIYKSFYITDIWAQALLLNIGTGILTSLLLILLFDIRSKYKSEQDLRMRRITAMLLLGSSIRKVLFLLVGMYQGATLDENDKASNIEKFEDFFDDKYFETILWFDFGKELKSDHIKGFLWYKYVNEPMSTFNLRLNTVLNNYGPILPAEIVLTTEKLTNSGFLAYVLNLSDNMDWYQQHSQKHYKVVYPGTLNDYLPHSLEEFISALLTLVQFYNSTVPKENQITLYTKKWIEIGSARIDSSLYAQVLKKYLHYKQSLSKIPESAIDPIYR
jgi:hypothetical protein